ncbi:hypothetical protein [Xanthobacter versatilis]|uniref:hypothetical protein n=1 Tax=Xanthobacter autotrophicus (strain ATCC BAA-1158 / Py2) TaxID=78245 RepID=UPI003727ED30
MPDLYHMWGEDLTASPTGDLAVVDGLDRTTQRIIRRLMTAVKGYIWHLDYGAGVPQRVGDVLDQYEIESIITSQIFLEESVARSPVPQITAQPITNGIAVSIDYWSAIDGEQKSLSFNVEA